jgi:hypothetical protein
MLEDSTKKLEFGTKNRGTVGSIDWGDPGIFNLF